MTELDAKQIGIAFLTKTNNDFDDFGNSVCLGNAIDYTIFYAYHIVSENGEFYLGGEVLLIDKRTSFCLIVASSPNFFEYHVRLFRIMKLHELYDEKIDYTAYSNKKTNLNFDDFVQAIFLLLRSHPNNLNAFLVFLDLLILFEEESIKNNVLKELSYKAVTSDTETLEIFCRGCEMFKENSLVKSKVNDLERNLLKKELTINDLYQRNDKNNQEFKKEVERRKAFIEKEKEKEKLATKLREKRTN